MNPIQPPPPPPPGAAFLASHPRNLQPAPSITAAFSELTSLIDFSEATLRSLPTPIATSTNACFVPCPFNPNHRVPPYSLFSHYLNCPSPVSLPHTFHYSHTIRSSSTIYPPPSLPADSSDLTVSLDNYIAYNSSANSFFYQKCPGPVTLAASAQLPSSFSLPRVLYIECSDFDMDSSLKGLMGFPVDFIQLLPSEIWFIRTEIEAWGGGFPSFYSSRTLRAILRLRDDKVLHLYEWIIVNSPRYGVIIDSSMRDHVVVLVKLCLKAIVREAFELAGVKCGDGELKKKEDVFPALRNQSFECPVLVKVMMWLALQFTILYGEAKGKFFAVDMLKECISDSASRGSLFPLDGNDAVLSDNEKVGKDVEEPVQSIESISDTKRDEGENYIRETTGKSMIFISEVAAAVAALGERSLIEEKIVALRYSQPLSAYQRNMEHVHFSKLADEERQRRVDYRPIIEHDGFIRQRSNNQEANKIKTREELLAEERDYKRRRMSYRGKKHKRSTLEVMRDIIDEYMEEIRQAGGIGGTSKCVEETEALAYENLDRHASATYVTGSGTYSETPEANSSLSVDYRKDLHSHHHSGDFKEDNQRSRQDLILDHGRQFSNRNVDSARYARDDRSESWDGYSRRPHQRINEALDGKYYKRGRDEHERRTHKRRRDERERSSHKAERDADNWDHGSRGRSKTDNASQERDEGKGGHAGRRKSKTNRNSSSCHELHEFEDRYEPAVSHD